MKERAYAESLLTELLNTPKEFNQNPLSGYNLLNEYLRGFKIESLIPALESRNPQIYRTAISISSELKSEACEILLPYLLELIDIETEPLYLHYIFNAVFKGTYNQKHQAFIHILYHLKSEEPKIQASVMSFLELANIHQLQESHKILREKNDEIYLVQGLSYLMEAVNSDLKGEFVRHLITDTHQMIQLFAGVISSKMYDTDSSLIRLSANSSNDTLKAFAISVIEYREQLEI
ncbi:MAG: hypothetical protein AAFP89_24130 [Bacteroidota bacterium]